MIVREPSKGLPKSAPPVHEVLRPSHGWVGRPSARAAKHVLTPARAEIRFAEDPFGRLQAESACNWFGGH